MIGTATLTSSFDEHMASVLHMNSIASRERSSARAQLGMGHNYYASVAAFNHGQGLMAQSIGNHNSFIDQSFRTQSLLRSPFGEALSELDKADFFSKAEKPPKPIYGYSDRLNLRIVGHPLPPHTSIGRIPAAGS